MGLKPGAWESKGREKKGGKIREEVEGKSRKKKEVFLFAVAEGGEGE